MLDQMVLQKEQEDLLGKLVEATRNVPGDQREPFFALPIHNGECNTFSHPGFPGGLLLVYPGDVIALRDDGLVVDRRGPRDTGFVIDVTPWGFAYYEGMKRRSGEPTREIESTVMEYLNAEPFRHR